MSTDVPQVPVPADGGQSRATEGPKLWNPSTHCFDLFSKRERRRRGDIPDVYVYDVIPEALRVQLVQIIRRCGMADRRRGGVVSIWKEVTRILRHEYGVFSLYAVPGMTESILGAVEPKREVTDYILSQESAALALDAVEVFLDRARFKRLRPAAVNAAKSVNRRFREHGVGYAFERGRIVRLDSEYLHVEATRVCLRLISGRRYAGVQEEFLRAHEHYRKDRCKEALNECSKALESTLKVIARERGWDLPTHQTLGKLLAACFKHGLVDQCWQDHFSSLQGLLASGASLARNRLGAHGQGSTPTSVPAHLVAFTLHSTAAAIVFLVSAESAGN